ncbi:MAG: PilZ domain-containing protein [Bdellovibrionales bacterium]|nr:PilZ domain-containing protein [Bdellovibrionales bacterium]
MEKNQITDDKKPAKRTHAKISILFKESYGRDFSHGSLHNISKTGAFLFINTANKEASKAAFSDTSKNAAESLVENTEKSATENSKQINLYIKLNKRNRKILAKVVWKTKNGYGLQFIRSSVQDKKLVDDLIYFEEQKNKTKQTILHNIFKKVA